MKPFSSSAVNKSGKKFAPKAPIRRPAPGGPRRPSTASQTQTPAPQTPQPVQKEGENAAEAGQVPPVSESPQQQPPVEESPATTEQAPIPESQPPKVAPRQGTAIAVPRPKRKLSVSAPAPTAIPAPARKPSPAVTAAPAPDTPSEQPTLPAEPTIVPSIENDVEQALTREAAAETSSLPTPAPAPASASTQDTQDTQNTAAEDAPTAIQRPTKRAKKTSEITKSKEWAQWQAPLTPASQPAVPSVEGPSENRRGSVASSPPVSQTPEPRRASTASKKRKPSKAGTTDGDSEKAKKPRRRREPTPDGAETVEILPNVIKMSELCKDLKTGKKSQREAEIRKWEAEQQAKKHKPQGTESVDGTPKKSNGTAEPDPQPEPEKQPNQTDESTSSAPVKPVGPVMRIVNGEIVLDASSLEVDRHAAAERDAGELESVEENQYSRRVNQATWGKRSKTETWDEERTDLFYRGLRMFGTDFMVISKMFPGRSRRQIKLKFNNEERKDPQRIKDTLLGPREVIDIDTYSQMTNATYDDPKLVQEELDEEKKKIEEEHEKEKTMQEELMKNTAEASGEKAAKGERENAPGKIKRNIKKKSQALGGGTEEVLGSI